MAKASVKKKPGAAGKAREPKPKVKQSSFIPFLDVTQDTGQQNFKKYADKVDHNKILVAPVYDKDGYLIGEAIFRVLDTAPHRAGLYALCELVIADTREAAKELKHVKPGGSMIHLCKSGSSSKETQSSDP